MSNSTIDQYRSLETDCNGNETGRKSNDYHSLRERLDDDVRSGRFVEYKIQAWVDDAGWIDCEAPEVCVKFLNK